METLASLGEWMTGKATSATGIRNKIMKNEERSADSPEIGKMFFYFYDPKMKKTLPVYDKFPLVLVMERYADGFLGLNLHYLSQGTRKALLNELLKYRNNKHMDERTKIRMSYELLGRTKMLRAVSPAIKRYLHGHVRSRFVEVTPSEWDKATALPVANFVRNK